MSEQQKPIHDVGSRTHSEMYPHKVPPKKFPTLADFPVTTLYTCVPPDAPWAPLVNRELKSLAGQTRQELYDGQLSSYKSDIESGRAGSTVPDTTSQWNQLRMVQCLIVEAYDEMGIDRNDLQSSINANKGPDAFWNFSCSELGLDGSAPSPLVVFATIIDAKTAELHTGIVNQ